MTATLEYMICAAPDCNTVIDPERWDRGKRTCDSKCRAAAFRARHGYRRVSDGGPVPVASEGRSHGSSGPSGKQLSFRKAVRTVTDLLVSEAGWDTGVATETAEAWLAAALPAKQRNAAAASRRKEPHA